MPAQPTIRVLSDLHLAHPASLIKSVSQLEPLLDGIQTVVFNGDTVELRTPEARERSHRYLEAIEILCDRHGVAPLFINGNHDPDVSELNHLELMGGRLMVTHGHVLFPSITPWGRDAESLRTALAKTLAEIGAGEEIALEDRLEAVRQACLQVDVRRRKRPGTRREWLLAVLNEMMHPSRAFHVVRAWTKSPALAERLLAQHRPAARCILLGHTHFPGHWQRNSKLVINTGCFLPWPGRRVVDLSAEGIVVREVALDKKRFHPGRPVGHWSLEAGENAAPVPQPNLVREARH